MIAENTKFKSNYSDKEIYKEIVNRMKDYKLKSLLSDDILLRAKLKIFNKKDKAYDREKVVQAIKDLIISNSNIKKFVITDLNAKLERISLNNTLKKLKNLEEWKEYINKENLEVDIFLISILLWIKDSKELNELGDKVFKEYLEGKFKFQEDLKEPEEADEEEMDNEYLEAEEMKMDDSILSMNLGECIKRLSSYEEKINGLEKRLKEKDKEIEELKARIKEGNETKEIKKELKDLTKSISNDSKIKELNNINSNIEKLSNKNIEIEKLLKNNIKNSFESQEKSIIKNINQLLADQQNAFKSTCKLYNEDLFEAIKNYLDGKIKENIAEAHKESKREMQKVNDLSIVTESEHKEKVLKTENDNPLMKILSEINLNDMN